MHIDLYATYLVAPKAKNRIVGYLYLIDKYKQNSANPTPKMNGPIHIECQLLKHVIFSAAEAKTSVMFLN